MKNLNPFFAIGTVGMIVTALLHMLLALVLGQSHSHTGFLVLYPVFIAFLSIGTGQLVGNQGRHSGGGIEPD